MKPKRKLPSNQVLGLLLLVTLSAVLHADSTGEAAAKADAKPDARADAKSETKGEAKVFEEPPPSITAHSLTIGGNTVKYHAIAGYIVLKEEEGKPLVKQPGQKPPSEPKAELKSESEPGKTKDGLKPKAKVFFVAYTLDDAGDLGRRPLTFAFNGGPGSSSVWLHMASVAPRRASLTDEGEAPPPPYKLTDNESTWLDRTDLVFIDPVSTGYSRPVAKEDPSQFHGIKEDIASVGDFIRLYTSRNARWLSPKFILGESYGTTRAAGLSDYLQNRYGFYLNGIILVSSALNFQAIGFSPQNNEPYIQFLPSYAASAWYHKKLPADLQSKSLAEVVAAARSFAANDYAPALGRGDRLSADDKQRLAGELSRFTGLPASDIRQWRLRIKDTQFFTHLLRGEGRMLGRFDSRFSGFRYEPGTDLTGDQDWEYDPSDEAVAGPLGAAFNDYVRRELQFESDIPYELVADVQPWNFGDAINGYPNTAEDLRKAMTRNPYLKIWVTCSYYDLATPFFGAENVIASMNLEPAIRANLRFTYYESGHMLYIHKPSRVKFKADFEAFLTDAMNQQPVHTTARGGQ
ncbi:MAG: peptidase S10 [Verrucomicrobia bacterium]|nr:peptidase S10 [Verrucomicrobiota bacterium]